MFASGLAVGLASSTSVTREAAHAACNAVESGSFPMVKAPEDIYRIILALSTKKIKLQFTKRTGLFLVQRTLTTCSAPSGWP